MRLQGRTAFVTGASRNIGRAIALAFAAEGADLVLNTRANREELEAVGEECRARGVRAVCVLGDVGDPDAVTRMVDEDRYCIDVIKQIRAVQSAVDKATALLLERHLHHCVTDAIRSDNPRQRERAVAELLEVFETRGPHARLNGGGRGS